MSPVSEVEEGGRQELALTWEDCLCPVCLDIFIEPVTLPCTHSFCKGCFLESVDKATLCCPMCRKRVSSWARRNNKKNTLVNLELWNRIQTLFPLQCQRRLNGQDAEEDDGTVPRVFPRVCHPGELRQEYEDQLMEERRAQDEEESKASEELIQKLLAEEQQQLQEEMRRKEEDERLAKLLSNQLNSQENLRVPDVAPVKKKKEVVMGHMDRFLCPCPPPGSAPGFITNKENILLMEAELHPEPRPPISSKRKSSELDPVEDEEVTSKRVQVCSPPGEERPLPDWEAELRVRKQQEEDDLHLALLLQRELDQEERRRATDRSKGSSDAYLLRAQGGDKQEAGPSHIPAGGRIRRMCSNSVSSSVSSSVSNSVSSSVSNSVSSSVSSSVSFPFLRSVSSASVVSRGSKQATLTEMFTLPRSRSSASAATRNAK
ncbi:E3 ubiquitin-protein ligase rnf168 isoform X2 [Xiphophorus couchianus]|uniref:E3 ubiquitin-protein ligase rnf168 isoform X2 n=1 Tax=Xiphophorus couchianus TaxID=32473 RepID=UPI001016E997|nr:E3 ubiquitin-protein ligase RNF168 isoform X2 [Xiphophorus couchianus]